MRNGEEYLRNKKYTRKGLEVEDDCEYEDLKKSHCGWSRGTKRMSGRDEAKEVPDAIGL